MHLDDITCYGFEGYDVSDSASRPGPKSSAQTPALPHERKEGSKKNKPGSAAKVMIESESDSITFSEKVTQSLKNKVKEHNSKSKRKVTLSQLKKVYRRGAGAFSQSHRPGKTRGQWAMARVNMFLKMMRGGKVKDSYRKADQDVAKSSTLSLDYFDEILMDEDELIAAQEELDELGIGHFDFEDVENDLFLSVDEKPFVFDIEL
jgi:hypothetical protein|tara:strand:+ start:1568 stop:2182 length:615 start_codon:yes stop_codon:yes gene_type:complete